MDDMEKKRAQVAAQCKVVAHLATVLAQVHSDYEKMFSGKDTGPNDLLDVVGARTASFMEDLGDMLNGMDAVDNEDEWTVPIFHEAQRLWPAHPSALVPLR